LSLLLKKKSSIDFVNALTHFQLSEGFARRGAASCGRASASRLLAQLRYFATQKGTLKTPNGPFFYSFFPRVRYAVSPQGSSPRIFAPGSRDELSTVVPIIVSRDIRRLSATVRASD
jgi:hypothetical protein